MPRVLGAPSSLSEAEAQAAASFLEAGWQLLFGQEMGEFGKDLQSLRELFDPVARGGRLRDRLQQVPASGLTRPEYIDDVAIVALDDERTLITPEGRGLREVLRHHSPDPDGVIDLDTPFAVDVERRVAAVVRSWSRHRLLDVIAKQSGHGPPMHAAAAAMVLLLLVNGSTSPATAVRRLEKSEQARFDRSIANIIEAFTRTARPAGAASREEFRMYGGWHLSEARRRLPGQLVVDDEGRIFVAPDQVARVIDFVITDLARSSIDNETLISAFDALVRAYRRELPMLTELGSGFESKPTVDRIRRRLQETK